MGKVKATFKGFLSFFIIICSLTACINEPKITITINTTTASDTALTTSVSTATTIITTKATTTSVPAVKSAPQTTTAKKTTKVKTTQQYEEMVWIPKTGSKYHSSASCSNMKNPSQVSVSIAQSRGYEPCKKCW